VILQQRENDHQYEVRRTAANSNLWGLITPLDAGNTESTGTAVWRTMAKQSPDQCEDLTLSQKIQA
jgi:hypothetical protein